MYWGDANMNKIETSNVNGSGRRTLLTESNAHYFAFIFHEGDIYFTDWQTTYVYCQLLQNANKQTRTLVLRLAWYTNHFETLRHGSHSLTCNKHHSCLYLVSVHQMAPSPIEVANI